MGQVATRARLPRTQRREQILAAATTAFARNGFTATGLDDIAQEAGVTRVLLYRHFDTKTDLYRAVLEQFCSVLSEHVTMPEGRFTAASIDGLLAAAIAEPDGFRLLFVHAARESEFKEFAERSRSQITETAQRQLSKVVGDEAWARWASRLAPTVAIEAIIAWLDSGRPEPERAAARIQHVVAGVIAAAVAQSDFESLPTG